MLPILERAAVPRRVADSTNGGLRLPWSNCRARPGDKRRHQYESPRGQRSERLYCKAARSSASIAGSTTNVKGNNALTDWKLLIQLGWSRKPQFLNRWSAVRLADAISFAQLTTIVVSHVDILRLPSELVEMRQSRQQGVLHCILRVCKVVRRANAIRGNRGEW